jgi:hypothetical protein
MAGCYKKACAASAPVKKGSAGKRIHSSFLLYKISYFS